MVGEGCWFEGVGGFWVGGGLVVSGSFAGVGAAGDQSGTAAAGVGVVEAVVGLVQGGEVVQAGGPALAPGGEVVQVAAGW